jgi:hypothetical protein
MAKKCLNLNRPRMDRFRNGGWMKIEAIPAGID